MRSLVVALLAFVSVLAVPASASRMPGITGGQGWQAIIPGTTQVITTSTGSSAKITTAVSVRTTVVRIYATQDAYVNIGTSSVTAAAADGASFYVPSGRAEYFGITGGQFVAAKAVTNAGSVFVTEGAL